MSTHVRFSIYINGPARENLVIITKASNDGSDKSLHAYSLIRAFCVLYKQCMDLGKDSFELSKVSKKAKLKNRYNQAPHLTQDTTWKSDKNT